MTAAKQESADAIEPFEQFVLSTIELTCRLEPGAIDTSTSMDELGLDSFACVAIATQVEVHHAVQFTSGEILGFFGASRVADLVSLIDAAVRQSRAREQSASAQSG